MKKGKLKKDNQLEFQKYDEKLVIKRSFDDILRASFSKSAKPIKPNKL